MRPDPRWLEILKASGWQTTAIAVACGLFFVIARRQWLPPMEPWVILSVAFLGLLCTCLAVASWASAIYKVLAIHKWAIHWIKIRREKRDVAAYIPHMTPEERQIIGYLLAWNYKTFTAESGGGHARTLLSRGIVTVFMKHGQEYEAQNVPMTIPDHVWDVLVQHKDQFPCAKNESQPHPWRVHWMHR